MKLYETNDLFNRELYIDLLASMNIHAELAKGGVLIDIDEYKKNYRASQAPHMVYLNHDFVKQLY